MFLNIKLTNSFDSIEMECVQMEKEQFFKEMESKNQQWLKLSEKQQENSLLKSEEIAFLLHEIGYLYDSNMQNDLLPASRLEQTMKINHLALEEMELIKKVLIRYFESIDFARKLELGLFGRKKVIDSCIDHAKETIKQTESVSRLLLSPVHLTKFVETMFEEGERKWEILLHQSTINRNFLNKDVEWMLDKARISLNGQMKAGIEYFDISETIEDICTSQKACRHAFDILHKAIQKVANEPIPLLDTGGHLKRMNDWYNEAEGSIRFPIRKFL